jgi:L-rhamnose isomerase
MFWKNCARRAQQLLPAGVCNLFTFLTRMAARLTVAVKLKSLPFIHLWEIYTSLKNIPASTFNNAGCFD